MMEKITKDAVFATLGEKQRREFFTSMYSGVQKDKAKPSFSVNLESTKKIFEGQTGLELQKSATNYWRFITPDEIEIAEQWEKEQSSMIFLRDCLSISVALDINLTNSTTTPFTNIGYLVHKGKKYENQTAVKDLEKKVSQAIQRLPYYKDADLICSVPPRPGKNFDLPSRVTSLASKNLGKQDVTNGFIFGGQKEDIKSSEYNEKWNVWEKAQVYFQSTSEYNVDDKTIILIDDMYQSGITIQYIAMKLQEAGAKEIYGLCFVKTKRNTGNK